MRVLDLVVDKIMLIIGQQRVIAGEGYRFPPTPPAGVYDESNYLLARVIAL